MFEEIKHFFIRVSKTQSIRKKVIVTALILVIFRLVAHVPASGIDRSVLSNLFLGSPLLSLLDVFSGGTLANFSIMALGLNPYINASIILQLLGYVVPAIEELQKEGEYGQEKINQYTRLATIPLAIAQSFGMYALLKGQGILTTLSPIELIELVVTMTAGTMFAVWLGELISEYGFKNGVSLLIFTGIVARLPVLFGQSLATIQPQDYFKYAIMIVIGALIVGFVIYVGESVRRIPIHHARRGIPSYQSGQKTDSSYLPLRLNQAGVIPIIFAVSLVMIPSLLGQFLISSNNAGLQSVARYLVQSFGPQNFLYNAIYFVLVVSFTYFYTAVIFSPEKISDDLKKSGGFIPGIRPGSETAKYLGFVLSRITIVGGVFLGFIAVLPSFFQSFIGVSNLSIGGTSVLIVVSVVLETIREMEGEMIMGKYDKLIQ